MVSTNDAHGNATIRLDPLRNNEGPIPNDRSTYPFGTTPNNRRLANTQSLDLAKLEDQEVCVFVLAPALAEVLEFDGHDIGLLARSKPNSYREAIFQCFDMPREFADVRALATCAVDASISSFEARFAADIMLGADMKTFADDIPADERNLESAEAHLADDRGLGGSATYESRHNVGRRRGGKVGSDLTGEFVAALSKGAIFASRDRNDGWKLEYDQVAAHGDPTEPMPFHEATIRRGMVVDALVVFPALGTREVSQGIVRRADDLNDENDDTVRAYLPMRRLQKSLYGEVFACLALKRHRPGGEEEDEEAAQRQATQQTPGLDSIVWESTEVMVAIKRQERAQFGQHADDPEGHGECGVGGTGAGQLSRGAHPPLPPDPGQVH